METQHFKERMRRRGIQVEVFEALRTYADHLVHLRGGCTAEIISRRRLRELGDDGILSGAIVERLSGLALVTSTNGTFVTVLHLHGIKAHYYTRDYRKSRRARRTVLGRRNVQARLWARGPVSISQIRDVNC